MTAGPLTPSSHDHPRSVPVHLLLLAAPVVASMLSRTVMGVIDFLMVAELGLEATAAILPAGMLLFCGLSLGWGVMTAVSTYVSQSLGRGKLEDCGRYAWQGVYLAMVMGVAVLPLIALVRPLFEWVDHGPIVREMEIDYAAIGILSMGPTIAVVGLSNFFTGVHRPMIATWSVIFGNVINVVLNYMLIYGHWGAPAMGIAGAAWGTLVGSLAQALFLFAWMMLPHYAQRYHTRTTWQFDRRRIMQLLRVGLPSGLQFFADFFAWATITLFLVGPFGKEQLAANNIVVKCIEVSFMPVAGLGMALSAAVGKCIGEGRHDLARKYVRWAVTFGVGYMGSLGLLMALNRHDLIAGFMQFSEGPDALQSEEAQEVIKWGGRLIICCAVFQMFDAMGITFHGALRGAGDTTWPMKVQIIDALVVCIGGGFFITYMFPELGAVGPWIAFTAYIMVIGSAMALRYRFGPWASIDLHGDDASLPAVGFIDDVTPPVVVGSASSTDSADAPSAITSHTDGPRDLSSHSRN